MLKLKETTVKFPQTQIWNDSCDVDELNYAIENGAVGATTNPVIVLNIMKKRLSELEPFIQECICNDINTTEDDIAWKVIKKMGSTASPLLLDQYKKTNGHQGRISFQTNAKYYRSKELMLNHGLDLASTVENSQIKAPTSSAGIESFEEMTYHGISINATVSFTVAQAIAVAEAVERGLNRRAAEGKDCSHINHVCTLMIGRVDDYLKKDVVEKKMLIEPEILEWAGIAVAKNAYKIYKERNYRTTLLIAAFRNPYHWLEFIGGDIILTIPYEWQIKYNNSKYLIESRIDNPVEENILTKLKELPEFNKAYLENGLTLEQFEHYGAFTMTLNSFLKGYDELVSIIRSYMVK